MGVSSSQLQPQELVTFKKLPTDVPLGDIDIPEREENRRPTNAKWLIQFGVFLLILLPFLIYTLYYSDLARLFYNYDKCGNVCGRTNYHWEGIECSGKDMTAFPYMEYEDAFTGPDIEDDFQLDLKERRCVRICKDGYTPVFGRCIRESSKTYGLDAYPGHDVTSRRFEIEDLDYGVYFSGVKWQLTICCLLSVLVAIGMVFMFRYAIAFVVWGILIGCFTSLVIMLIFFWTLYGVTSETSAEQREYKSVGLTLGIVFAALTLLLGIVLIWCRKKIRLVILLFRETSRAIFDMPGLVVIPVVFVVASLVFAVLFILVTCLIFTAGILEKTRADFYSYTWNWAMITTMVYNVVAFAWFSQFVTGIQYMIVAGAVSKWYFTREKTLLRRPISQSIAITVKYHLGTVALGSLLITIMQIIKTIILGLLKNQRIRCLMEAAISRIERFFKFLSKNAYIITAMHGQPLLKSGKRAAKLIIQNVGDIIAINYIGDFILGMAKFLIIMITLLLSVGIFSLAPGPVYSSDIPSYIIIGVVSAIVAFISFGSFETTVDTLFVCYCEDNLLNDGMARPYYMSRNLKEFVDESKKIYKKA